MWMPELRCSPAFPSKKGLVCATFRWLDVTLIEGNKVTFCCQCKTGAKTADPCAYDCNVLVHIGCFTELRKSIIREFTSSGASCCVQWPMPGISWFTFRLVT